MKKLKNILLLVFTFTFVFVNMGIVSALTVVNKDGIELTPQAFIYSYDLKIVLNPELQNGSKVALNAQCKSSDNQMSPCDGNNPKLKFMARWYNLNDVRYTPPGGTELTGEALYNYIQGIQALTDSEIEAGTINYSTTDPTLTSESIQKWNDLMQQQNTVIRVNGDTLGSALYCNHDDYYDEIVLNSDCTDQYYIVIAAVIELDDNGNKIDEAETARAYKVNADRTKCPVCTTENGKYYDDEGKEVTEAEYKKDCFSCKVENGKYYDKDGNETTEDKYNKQCHSCRIENGKYYDKDGKEVSEDDYYKACRACTTADGKYYNKVGKEVTKEVYEKECGNPTTGINNPYLFIAVIIATGAAIALVSRNKKYI